MSGAGRARGQTAGSASAGEGRGFAGLELHDTPDGVTLRVRVQPRASRDALGDTRGGVLVVRLTAPPVEGAANAALARFLARTLGVAPSAVRLLSGQAGRIKRVAVSGIDAAAARERLRDRTKA